MIDGIGTDIIDVARVERALSKGDAFKKKVFSPAEIAYCEKSGLVSYAGRFAAKEAFLKAVGTGLIKGMEMFEIEVLNDNLGKPTIHVFGNTLKVLNQLDNWKIHVSISHISTHATAFVVIEKVK